MCSEKGKNIGNLIFLRVWHGNFLLVYFFLLKSLTWIPKKMDVQTNGFEKPRHATLSMSYNLVCPLAYSKERLVDDYPNTFKIWQIESHPSKLRYIPFFREMSCNKNAQILALSKDLIQIFTKRAKIWSSDWGQHIKMDSPKFKKKPSKAKNWTLTIFLWYCQPIFKGLAEYQNLLFLAKIGSKITFYTSWGLQIIALYIFTIKIGH